MNPNIGRTNLKPILLWGTCVLGLAVVRITSIPRATIIIRARSRNILFIELLSYIIDFSRRSRHIIISSLIINADNFLVLLSRLSSSRHRQKLASKALVPIKVNFTKKMDSLTLDYSCQGEGYKIKVQSLLFRFRGWRRTVN